MKLQLQPSALIHRGAKQFVLVEISVCLRVLIHWRLILHHFICWCSLPCLCDSSIWK